MAGRDIQPNEGFLMLALWGLADGYTVGSLRDEWGYVVMPTARQSEIALHCDVDRVYAKLVLNRL